MIAVDEILRSPAHPQALAGQPQHPPNTTPTDSGYDRGQQGRKVTGPVEHTVETMVAQRLFGIAPAMGGLLKRCSFRDSRRSRTIKLSTGLFALAREARCGAKQRRDPPASRGWLAQSGRCRCG
jgi:hypothetical protein